MPGLKELKTEIAKPAYTGKSDAEIIASLNGPDATSPVPRKMTVKDVMAKFSDPSLAKLNKHPSLVAFRDDVARHDHAAVLNWLGLALKGGDCTNSDANDVAAYVNGVSAGPPKSHAIMGGLISEGDLTWARRHN